MFGIRNSHDIGVSEYQGSPGKTDLMFLQVFGGLGFVPLEFHFQPSSYYHPAKTECPAFRFSEAEVMKVTLQQS